MKTYRNLYKEICARDNLELAFEKSRKGKTNKSYVKIFEENLDKELSLLEHELKTETYQPKRLKRFIVRDPKSRVIHSSHFRDRVVYHAIINVIGPIFEKSFIHDSYASRKEKGTLNAVKRFDRFKREVSNGKQVKNAIDNNQVTGYVLKADIRKYFERVDQDILLRILRKKIKDLKVIHLIEKILINFDTKNEKKGMPLGNLTSQFFANVYLNELDYFVKNQLKAKHYIRYVDDFVILHKDKNVLEEFKDKISIFLKEQLSLELHEQKSKIMSLSNGISFLGYKIWYHYKLPNRRNKRKFKKNFERKLMLYEDKMISDEDLYTTVNGWFGYVMWSNTYKYKKEIIKIIKIKSKSL